jgi:hypothetical protein
MVVVACVDMMSSPVCDGHTQSSRPAETGFEAAPHFFLNSVMGRRIAMPHCVTGL